MDIAPDSLESESYRGTGLNLIAFPSQAWVDNKVSLNIASHLVFLLFAVLGSLIQAFLGVVAFPLKYFSGPHGV